MATTAQAVSTENTAPFLARQPILTKDEKVIGYEVWSGPASANTGDILKALTEVSLDVISCATLTFIPCTQEMLLQEVFFALPFDKIVVEIQPEVEISGAVSKACERLKQEGYKIAIDKFCAGDSREQLLPLASLLKVDWTSEGHAELTAAQLRKPYKILAQKVESRAAFAETKKAGFTLFQGNFFRYPEQMRVRQIPAGQTSRLRLLQAVSVPEVDFDLVEELIRHDASLCVRLLRYLNSPLLGFSVPIQSVRLGIGLLGERAIIRWIRSAIAMNLGQPKCSDLVLASLVRARFCELIASKVDHGSADLFLLGMLSLMDAILETPMEIVLEGLAFDPHAKAALLAIKNGGGTRLSPICDLMIAREKGDWERVVDHATKLELSLPFVNQAYIEAMGWAHEMTTAAHPQSNAR